ncbi:hypothetical protein ABAZ39_07295 [Azospirillum argentinense]|uniref:Uncharacterized protein n=2 Tax=Azospirillum argentinense TaxID=2970906 RepID=A0A060DGF2_9PROT|nr:hypothetical protein ABAZ39_07295 [Azospirillum argentinense]EZQ09765.1 hypothetical protein ABAZ39_08715 [Azospirillum argentinense]
MLGFAMTEQPPRRLFVVEDARHRAVVSAWDAGRARAVAAAMLLGSPCAERRDALVVREPEEEERAAFEGQARRIGQGDCGLTAIPL